MLCTTCNRNMPDEAQYCAGCGTALALRNGAPTTLSSAFTSATPLRVESPPTPQVNVTVNAVASAAPVVVLADRAAGPGWLVRGLYFVFVGWWLSQLWILAAWTLNLTVLGLPLGLLMLNRLPQVVTLKAAATRVDVAMLNGAVVVSRAGLSQHSFLLRALYFVLVGWWASLLWVETAWLLTLTVLGLPLAFWMFDRTPVITTLARS